MPSDDPVPALLRPIWERNLPVIRERLDHLDHTAACALSHTLSTDDLELARSNAHKLIGSLGTFGYPDGSDLARAIEALLEADISLDGTLLKQLTNSLRSILKIS